MQELLATNGKKSLQNLKGEQKCCSEFLEILFFMFQYNL